MKRKSEVMQAVKQFAKETLDAIICDAAKEQTSQNLRQFCHGIGITLRVFEEGTLGPTRQNSTLDSSKKLSEKT